MMILFRKLATLCPPICTNCESSSPPMIHRKVSRPVSTLLVLFAFWRATDPTVQRHHSLTRTNSTQPTKQPVRPGLARSLADTKYHHFVVCSVCWVAIAFSGPKFIGTFAHFNVCTRVRNNPWMSKLLKLLFFFF